MATKEKLQCLKDFHKDILKPSPGKSPGTRPEDEAEGKPPQRGRALPGPLQTLATSCLLPSRTPAALQDFSLAVLLFLFFLIIVILLLFFLSRVAQFPQLAQLILLL